MRVTKQVNSECMLVTIGAISNTPLTQIRKVAKEIVGGSWSKTVIGNPILYWNTVDKLKKHYKITTKIPSWSQFIQGNKRRKLPDGKKGSITTTKKGSSKTHITPFSNGLIYGTHKEKPISLKDYKKQLDSSGLELTGIWY